MRRAWLVITAIFAAGCPGPRAPAPTVTPLSGPAYAHYLRGRVAGYEGDHALAAEELRAAAAAAPGEPRIEVERIRALLKAGRKHDAQLAIAAAETRWPASWDVWVAAADLARVSGALGAARAAYQRAVAIDPAGEPAYLGLAVTYLALH